MTKPKPMQFRAKIGRKPKRLKKQQDKLLKKFYDAGDVPPWQASLYAKCGYEYALMKYEDFFGYLTGREITSRFSFQKKIGILNRF